MHLNHSFACRNELLVLFSMYQLKLHQFHVLIHYIGCQFTKQLSIFKCLLMYNIVNNNLYPKYLKCYMKLKPAVHYNLRQDDTLMVPFPHREIFKKSLQFNGVLLWNNLPTELKEAPSYDNLRQKCKVYVRNNVSFY